MYRSILVPLDGSWFGEHALPAARSIAKASGAGLHLVHVHRDASIPAAVESLPYLGSSLPLDPADGDAAYLEGVVERLGDAGVRTTTSLIQGPLTQSLERYAIENGADLVVACTHCHEGLARIWHRGVGEQMVRDISIPILLIRSDETQPELKEERGFRHILLPLDGSLFAEEILNRAVPLGRMLGARLTLLRVVRPMTMMGYTLLGHDTHVSHFLLEEQQQEAESYLSRIAERLRSAGLEVGTRVVTSEEPAQAIVDATRPDPGRPPVDMIAMTTHCRGPLSRFVLSSISDSVLHSAPVPVLLYHPLAAEAEEITPSKNHAVLVEREA
jgi:nucleotide-binding universal stress UspA family protein